MLNPIEAVQCVARSDQKQIASVFSQVKTYLTLTGFHLRVLFLPWTEDSNIMHLQLYGNQIEDIPEGTFSRFPLLGSLALGNNSITHLAASVFHPLLHLEYLDLSENYLASWNEDLIIGNPLIYLYLDSNLLTNFSDKVLLQFQRISRLSLYNNSWDCPCNNSLQTWIIDNRERLTFPEHIRCNGTETPVMLANVPCEKKVEVLVLDEHAHTTIIPAISSVATVAVILLVLGSIAYVHRFFLSVLVYTYLPHCSRMQPNNDTSQRNGVFAIYDDQERDAFMWVKDHLIPHVETEEEGDRRFCRLICYDRDFLPGIDMMDNIESAIKATHCCVMLLTEEFLDNHWSHTMFQAVFCEIRERRRPYKIVPVLWRGVSIKDITSHHLCPADLANLLRTNRVLHVDSRFFWSSLAYLSRHSQTDEGCCSKGKILEDRILKHILKIYCVALEYHHSNHLAYLSTRKIMTITL